MNRKTYLFSAIVLLTFLTWSFKSNSDSDGGIVTVHFMDDFGLNMRNSKTILVIYAEGYVEEQVITRRMNENTYNQDLAINAKLNELYKRGYRLVGQSESSVDSSHKHITYTLQK
jgi:hypothetical protein